MGFCKEGGSQLTNPDFFFYLELLGMLIPSGSERNRSSLADTWACPLCCSLPPSAPSVGPQHCPACPPALSVAVGDFCVWSIDSFPCMGLSPGQGGLSYYGCILFCNCGQGPSLGLLPTREGLPYRGSSAKERRGYMI